MIKHKNPDSPIPPNAKGMKHFSPVRQCRAIKGCSKTKKDPPQPRRVFILG